jgi:hypothetical protein
MISSELFINNYMMNKDRCDVCDKFYITSGTDEGIYCHMRQDHGIPI